MEIDELIEAIRNEEVALVIGSGMSLYAGYLGVKDLTALIRKKAQSYSQDDWESKSFEEKSLEDISEILVRFANGDRSELNSILVSTYKKSPAETHTHDLLSRIPHFEHIFTTNYDTLIEQFNDYSSSTIKWSPVRISKPHIAGISPQNNQCRSSPLRSLPHGRLAKSCRVHLEDDR